MANSLIGIGDSDFKIAVCIGNRPDTQLFQSLTGILPFSKHALTDTVNQTGNHWRKIFNIYAKLMNEIEGLPFETWQEFRDRKLLTEGSRHAIIFSDVSSCLADSSRIIIVSGKTYAQAQGVLENCTELSGGFFFDVTRKLVVTPYFDYRQLSNAKINELVSLLREKLLYQPSI
jgi:hypothetical protein